MIGYMERTCRLAVLPLLDSGYDTVGTRVNVSHLAAAPVGAVVTFTAEVTGVNDRRILFRVEARDETEKIGEGTHERTIINVARFASRLASKNVNKGLRSQKARDGFESAECPFAAAAGRGRYGCVAGLATVEIQQLAFVVIDCACVLADVAGGINSAGKLAELAPLDGFQGADADFGGIGNLPKETPRLWRIVARPKALLSSIMRLPSQSGTPPRGARQIPNRAY